MKKNTSERKIDIVYTWVDGNDERWKKIKAQYTGEVSEEVSNASSRFSDNDELKYSLRSVEKYAPWINHIYIITDNQIPMWLNTDNPKVTIVDHKEIMPSDALPTYNSLAIEYCMHKISDLSEYFLYANDDMFFTNPVTPDFFYTKDDKPICRFRKKMKHQKDSQYTSTLNNAIRLLKNKGYKFPEYTSHHSIDSYRKSIIIDCYNEFKGEIEKTIHARFRTSDDVQRIIYMYYAVATKRGVFKRISKIDSFLPFYKRIWAYITKQYSKDSRYFTCFSENIAGQIKEFNTKLICINDRYFAQSSDRENITKFLNLYYTEKSSFEK